MDRRGRRDARCERKERLLDVDIALCRGLEEAQAEFVGEFLTLLLRDDLSPHESIGFGQILAILPWDGPRAEEREALAAESMITDLLVGPVALVPDKDLVDAF